MARFYQTSKPEFVSDNMFQLPWQLMANTLMNKEKAVDAEIASANSFLDKLTAQGLSPDQPRLQEKISSYETRVNDIVQGIKKNPLEYNTYTSAINTLGREISKDWSMGEIAKIEANRKAYTDYSTQLDEAYKKNPDKYSPNQIDLLKKQALNKYKALGGAKYNPTSGIYNQFSGEDALQLDNVTDTLNQNVGKYIKSDGGEKAFLNTEGRWVIKTHKGEEYVSEQKLRDAAKAYLESAPEIMSAVAQRTSLGIQGFENPVDYLQDSINSFVLANQFKKDSITKDASVNPYSMKDYEDSFEKKKEQEDMITYFSDDYIVGTGGRNWNEFNQLRAGIMGTIDTTKDRARQLISDTYGYKNEADFKIKNPLAYNRIRVGNFSDVLGLPGGKELASEYKQAKYNLAGQTALQKSYRTETGRDPEQDKTGFSTWLASRGTIAVNRTSSWKDFGVTTKQIDQVAKRFIDDGNYLTSSIRFPKGTTMSVGNSKVDLGAKDYTLNEMIKLGLVEPEPVKVPIIGETSPAIKDKDGKVLVPAQTEVQYRLTDGTGTIGFKTGGKGIVPVTSYNNEGKIELGAVVNFRGQNFQARINDVQTQSMIDYNNTNSKVLKTKLQLEKWSGSGDVVIPDTGGAIYHSQDVIENGKVKYKKGQITIPLSGNKAETYNTSDPAILEKLSNWLYE